MQAGPTLNISEFRDRAARSANRLEFTAEAGIRRAGVRGYRVRVFDASREGCKIEFIERPTVGERIWVKFDGLEALEGTVRWIAGHLGGVKFQRPLHEAVFQQLARASRPGRG
jgi:hypothetical protein